MDLGLQDKVVMVTGASSGIGAATAARLGAEGARLAICARRTKLLDEQAERIRETSGAEVLTVTADLSTVDGVARFADATLAHYGRLDGVVNNAGNSAARPFLDVSDADWQRDLDIKLFAPIRLLRQCLPYLRESRGAVVSVTAIGGKQPGPRSVPSTVTRAAGIALFKALSKEYAADGVRLNAVCIGTVRSHLHDPEWQAHFPELSQDEFYGHFIRQRGVPMGRPGEPHEVADLVAFLLSDRGAYISGAAINFDGAWAAVL